MRQHLCAIICAILFFSTQSSPATAQKADPGVFGALPAFEDVVISPDGQTLAFIQNFSDGKAVVFKPISAGGSLSGAKIGAVKARYMRWVSNDHVLLQVSKSETINTVSGLKTYELWRWVSIRKDGKKPSYLFSGDNGFGIMLSAGSLLSTLPDNPDHVLMAHYLPAKTSLQKTGAFTLNTNASDGEYSLFQVNLNNGRERRIAKGESDTWDWLTDRYGNPKIRIDYDSDAEEKRFYRVNESGKRFELVSTMPEKRGVNTLSARALTDDPDVILVTSYAGNDKLGIHEFNIHDLTYGRTIYRNDKYDLDRVIWNDDYSRIDGAAYIADMPVAEYFDPALQTMQRQLADAIPNSAVKIVSLSSDNSRAIVRIMYTDFPDEHYFFDRSSNQLANIATTYPALSKAAVAHKEKYDYTTTDGLKINGYLTAPINTQRRNMPLIVLPHGGPEGRDDQRFDWWAFFYAARGYAVYQPNFRGSDGYGLKFRESGFGEWGRKMQDDITDGVKKLISDGIVDPSRICIVGASYGGYAALAGATLTPELYACAISVNGVSDLPEMLGVEAAGSDWSGGYWEIRIGSRFKDTDELDAVSPAMIASAAMAPIMLIHGKDDTVVPFGQSVRMKRALEAAGKPFEFVELDGEDHWLSGAKTRTEMLRRSIEFIDEHIGQQGD